MLALSTSVHTLMKAVGPLMIAYRGVGPYSHAIADAWLAHTNVADAKTREFPKRDRGEAQPVARSGLESTTSSGRRDEGEGSASNPTVDAAIVRTTLSDPAQVLSERVASR